MRSVAELKRVIGLPLLVFYGLGNILGAGIYVLVGKVAGVAGFHAPFAFLLAATVAAFSAFSYAELSARYPVAAGEAVYLEEGFGIRGLSILTGFVIAMAGILSAATIVRGVAGYIQWLPIPNEVLILMMVMGLTLIALVGVGLSVMLAAALTLVELGGLLLLIAVGFWHPVQPEVVSQMATLPAPSMMSGIVAGAFIAFYAFLGYEDIVNLAEEVKSPHTTLPRAIILALVVSTLMYVLIAVAALMNMSPEQLFHSQAPMADLYLEATGQSPWLITAITGFAVINGALVQIIMASRICYGMASKGWLPSVLAKVSDRRKTPLIATILVGIVVALMASQWATLSLAKATSYLILLIFLLVNLALLRIKERAPDPAGVRCYPAWVPRMGALGAGALIVAQWL